MAQLNSVVEARTKQALRALEQLTAVEAAYVFGSQADNSADEWSDIDIAAFAKDVERWNIEKRAEVSAYVQRIAGDDIEIHLFPAALLTAASPAGFAAYVKATGIPIAIGNDIHSSPPPADELPSHI